MQRKTEAALDYTLS